MLLERNLVMLLVALWDENLAQQKVSQSVLLSSSHWARKLTRLRKVPHWDLPREPQTAAMSGWHWDQQKV